MVIRASQAEICYWASYSLGGTKRMRKVFKSVKTRTLPRALPPGASPALHETRSGGIRVAPLGAEAGEITDGSRDRNGV
ncbi:hypothetical protein Stsp01_45580 [Streptomyces sp. NBRC 13847]|nr:hypothetical protein Stsp01_45580 [Streptomyces sp. NBRC 13847]